MRAARDAASDRLTPLVERERPRDRETEGSPGGERRVLRQEFGERADGAHAKTAALAEALIGALTDRGIPEPTARLATEAGAAVFERASRAWNGTSAEDLNACITRAATELAVLTQELPAQDSDD